MINEISFPYLNLNFTVDRAFLKIGDFPIYTYGVIIVFGLVIAAIYGYNAYKKSGLNPDDFYNMLLIAVPVSIICARLYYVIFSLSSYIENPIDIINIRNGGLAIYGGIIGAAAVIFIYCRKKKIPIDKVLDVLAIGLLIGQAIGRWGNFVNGEAFGGPTSLPWAMTIKSGGVLIADKVHPTFLYESLWNALGIAVLLVYKKHIKFSGQVFCGYMIWYGIGRAIIEGLRTDSLYWGAFRVSQILSVLLVIFGIILTIVFIKKQKKI